MTTNTKPTFFYSILILVLLLTQIIPVKANVDIDVLLVDGDATISLNQENGVAEIIVNNMDVLQEWKDAQQSSSAYLQMIYYLGARNDVSDVEDDLDALEAELNLLIDQLNEILPQMESRSTFALRAIGVDHNSSDVVTNLRSLNMTVADYLESHEGGLETQEIKLRNINKRLESIKLELDIKLNKIDVRIQENTLNTTAVKDELLMHIEAFEQNTQDTDGKFVILGSLMAGTIVILLVLVSVQSSEYMRLKKRLDVLTPKEKVLIKIPPGLENIEDP